MPLYGGLAHPLMSPEEFSAAQFALGWSAARFAEELGVTERAVRQFRSGERRVSGPVEKLVRIYVQSLNAEQSASFVVY